MRSGSPEKSFRADSYQQVAVSDGSRQIRFSTIDLCGNLKVLKPDLLVDLVGQGLGSSKSFGCGLMLLRSSLP